MKQALREQSRDKRKAISPNLRAEKSKKIRHLLERTQEFKNAKKVLFYISTTEEVETHGLVEDCIASGKEVYIPKITGKKLSVCRISNLNELEPGAYGILEPRQSSNFYMPEDMDLIIVPGIAFGLCGHRIGYGKGFYDRLLKKTKGIKIGLAFAEQIMSRLPSEPHDIAMDIIITDKELIRPMKDKTYDRKQSK